MFILFFKANFFNLDSISYDDHSVAISHFFETDDQQFLVADLDENQIKFSGDLDTRSHKSIVFYKIPTRTDDDDVNETKNYDIGFFSLNGDLSNNINLLKVNFNLTALFLIF